MQLQLLLSRLEAARLLGHLGSSGQLSILSRPQSDSFSVENSICYNTKRLKCARPRKPEASTNLSLQKLASGIMMGSKLMGRPVQDCSNYLGGAMGLLYHRRATPRRGSVGPAQAELSPVWALHLPLILML